MAEDLSLRESIEKHFSWVCRRRILLKARALGVDLANAPSLTS